jgi:signal transduction histidine kinase/PleD family two-component response regulator/PAS domain-containing protein
MKWNIHKKKKTIYRMFLIPLLIIILVQSMLTFGILVFQKTTKTIQDYSVSMLTRTVENRKVILQNDMIQKWASVADQEEQINWQLEIYLAKKDLALEQLMASENYQDDFLMQIFPNCLNMVENSQTTGLFLVMTGENPEEAENLTGFFVRDSNPQVNANHSDLLMERGNKELSRTFHVGMDTLWTSVFEMHGMGQRMEDEYFYEPWYAALQNPQADIEDLGYWSEPFVLDEDKTDAHEMITYSVPLRYQGYVYAVLGVEISLDYLYDYLPADELSRMSQSGYALAVEQTDGSYKILTGKGVLYNNVKDAADTFTVSEIEYNELYQVDDISLGRQSIYAAMFPLKLYSDHVPYENTNWVLIGLNQEEELFGIGRELYLWMTIALLAGLVFGVICITYVIHRLTRPIQRLMSCIRKGRAGLQEYQPSNILEVDALYEVVRDLTEQQKESRDVLLEEKELYRVSLETTQDGFFSYDLTQQTIDIINCAQAAGHWNCQELENKLVSLGLIYEEDLETVQKLFHEVPDQWNEEIRMRFTQEQAYHWIGLQGKVICNTEGHRWKAVGRFFDIQEQKEREEQERKRIAIDGVTGFYSYLAGLEELEIERKNHPDGVVLCLMMENLKKISEQNGMTYVDMILEEFGQIVQKRTRSYDIRIRLDVDNFCIWLRGGTRQVAERLKLSLKEELGQHLDEEVFPLSISTGIAQPIAGESALDLIRRAKMEQNDTISADADWLGEQVVSTNYQENLSMVSLALQLFGKGTNMNGQMYLFFRKLGDHYHAGSVMLLMIQEDFHSIYREYQWNREKQEGQVERVFTYRQEELEAFTGQIEENGFLIWDDEHPIQPGIAEFCGAKDSVNGFAVPLYDNGSIMGVLSIRNADPALLEEEGERKNLLEIGSIIQSQMNQQRHDLASKAKSDFLSRMSHEIRTPMNGIIGMTELALRQDQSAAQVRDCLLKIQSASDYLLGLINDILDMSRIESGNMELSEETFSMSELLKNVMELVQSQMKEKMIVFHPQIDLVHDWFTADRLRISQVLVNLLGNAVKFTDYHGQITLIVKETIWDEQNAAVYFSIQDTGIGIQKEDQERIFRSFEQAQNNMVTGKKGTGLGLAISGRLVKLMGSHIHLESEPGKGSNFYFSLTMPLGNEQEAKKEEDECVFFDGCRILLAEDNELNAEIAQSILEDYHFQVDWVENGEQAVRRMEESVPGTYDLILTDIMMPVMDGQEAARRIRAIEREDCQKIPIIAMSANAYDDDLKKCVECGMNGHLSKPIEIDKMYKMIRDLLHS